MSIVIASVNLVRASTTLVGRCVTIVLMCWGVDVLRGRIVGMCLRVQVGT